MDFRLLDGIDCIPHPNLRDPMGFLTVSSLLGLPILWKLNNIRGPTFYHRLPRLHFYPESDTFSLQEPIVIFEHLQSFGCAMVGDVEHAFDVLRTTRR